MHLSGQDSTRFEIKASSGYISGSAKMYGSQLALVRQAYMNSISDPGFHHPPLLVDKTNFLRSSLDTFPGYIEQLFPGILLR